MSTKAIGDAAEQLVEQDLIRGGYEILDRNWRTRYCEIDIVAKKDNCVYFVEVKYRKNSYYGNGFEVITPKKLQQMTFAAEMWVSARSWSGDYALMAGSVSGVPPTIDEIIQI
jgi:Holliday junction resolvase-like predicted endonuclease